MTIDERIARNIIKAQIASDSGKDIENRTGAKNQVARGPERFGYDAKTYCILQALKLIRTNKNSMFNYYVTEKTADQNGYGSIIVYFDFNIDKKRYQISFHTPYNQVPDEMMKMCGTGRKTHWKKNVSSIESVKALVKKFNLQGQI
jgi:hypothetical protein